MSNKLSDIDFDAFKTINGHVVNNANFGAISEKFHQPITPGYARSPLTVKDIFEMPSAFVKDIYDIAESSVLGLVHGIKWLGWDVGYRSILSPIAQLEFDDMAEELTKRSKEVVDFTKNLGQATWQHLREYYEHPLEKIVRHPGVFLLDAITASNLIGTSAIKFSEANLLRLDKLRGKIPAARFNKLADDYLAMRKWGQMVNRLPSDIFKKGKKAVSNFYKQSEQFLPALEELRTKADRFIFQPISRKFLIGAKSQRFLNGFLGVRDGAYTDALRAFKKEMEDILPKTKATDEQLLNALAGIDPLTPETRPFYNFVKDIVDDIESSSVLRSKLTESKLEIARWSLKLKDEFTKRLIKSGLKPAEALKEFQTLWNEFLETRQLPTQLKTLLEELKVSTPDPPVYFPLLFDFDKPILQKLRNAFTPRERRLKFGEEFLLRRSLASQNYIKDVRRVIPRMVFVKSYFRRLGTFFREIADTEGIKVPKETLERAAKSVNVSYFDKAGKLQIKSFEVKFRDNRPIRASALKAEKLANDFKVKLLEQGFKDVKVGTEIGEIPGFQVALPEMLEKNLEFKNLVLDELEKEFRDVRFLDNFNEANIGRIYDRVVVKLQDAIDQLDGFGDVILLDDITAGTLRELFRLPNSPLIRFFKTLNQPLYWMWLFLRPGWLVNQIFGNTILLLLTGNNPLVNFKFRDIAIDAFDAEGMNIMARTAIAGRPLPSGAKEIGLRALSSIQDATRFTDVVAKKAVALKYLDRKAREFAIENFKIAPGALSQEGRLKFIRQQLEANNDFLRAREEYDRLLSQKAVRDAQLQELKKSATDRTQIAIINREIENIQKRLDFIDRDLQNRIRPAKELFEEAIKEAQITLSNYLRASPFERYIMGTIFPFYSFTRTMLLFTLKYPFKHPLKARLYSMMGQVAQDMRHTIFRDRPYWMPVAVFDDEGEETWLILNTRTWNPIGIIPDISGIFELDFSKTLNEIFQITNPFIKIAIESGTGINLWNIRPFFSGETGITLSGRPFEFDAETGKLILKPPAPPFFKQIIELSPQIKFLDDMLHPYFKDTTGTLFSPKPLINRFTGNSIKDIPRKYTLAKYFGFNLYNYKTSDLLRMEADRRQKILNGAIRNIRRAQKIGDEDTIQENKILIDLLRDGILEIDDTK